MRIVELWRYPVKSMQGEQVSDVTVDLSGIVGDRRWAVAERATGRILTGRRTPRLLFARAITSGTGRPQVVLPDGKRLASDEELSHWLGFPVEMVAAPAQPWRYEILTDDTDEPASEWLEWEGGPGAFHNSSRSPISIIDRSSSEAWDLRRFRMNVVVDVERLDVLFDRRVRLGSAEAYVGKRTGRCVMVTRPQPGLPEDRTILKAIVHDHGGCWGLGATVTTAGRIRVDESIEVLAD